MESSAEREEAKKTNRCGNQIVYFNNVVKEKEKESRKWWVQHIVGVDDKNWFELRKELKEVTLAKNI